MRLRSRLIREGGTVVDMPVHARADQRYRGRNDQHTAIVRNPDHIGMFLRSGGFEIVPRTARCKRSSKISSQEKG